MAASPERPIRRRSFLCQCLSGTGALLTARKATAAPGSPRSAVAQPGSAAGPTRGASPLQEHGFWDYPTPIAGGMERYTQDACAARLVSRIKEKLPC